MVLLLWPKRKAEERWHRRCLEWESKNTHSCRLWRLAQPNKALQLDHKPVCKPQGELNDCIIWVRAGNWVLSPREHKFIIRLNYGIFLHLLIFLLTELFRELWLKVPTYVALRSMYPVSPYSIHRSSFHAIPSLLLYFEVGMNNSRRLPAAFSKLVKWQLQSTGCNTAILWNTPVMTEKQKWKSYQL